MFLIRFVFRWCKRLVYLGLFGAVCYAVSGYVPIHGKPARDYATEFLASPLWKEGTKDLRTWLAALLRFASDKVEEGITPADQAELNAVIKDDLRRQIEAVKRPVQ